jgi:hypothetical protein
MPNKYLAFTKASIAAQEPIVAKAFGLADDDLLELMVATYLKQNQPRAALKVAERIAAFQPNNNSEPVRNRQLATHTKLLALLSAAAEQIGDLNRAVELERLRMALDKTTTSARLAHLEQLQNAVTRKAFLIVDQKLTTDYTD